MLKRKKIRRERRYVVEAGIRARPVLHNARVGISVVDVASGRELYARDADGAYNAASNTKIFTTSRDNQTARQERSLPAGEAVRRS